MIPTCSTGLLVVRVELSKAQPDGIWHFTVANGDKRHPVCLKAAFKVTPPRQQRGNRALGVWDAPKTPACCHGSPLKTTWMPHQVLYIRFILVVSTRLNMSEPLLRKRRTDHLEAGCFTCYFSLCQYHANIHLGKEAGCLGSLWEDIAKRLQAWPNNRLSNHVNSP